MNNEYYVYTHTKVGDDKPFYIGKGKGGRAYDKSRGRSKFWKRVAKKGFVVEFEFEHLDEATALQMEKDMIQMWGRRDIGTGPLVNLTDGGDGVSGKIYTEEEKQHKRNKSLAFWSDPINVEAQRVRNKGINTGRLHTDESKDKMSKAKLGKPQSKEFIAKRAQSNKGKKRSSATKLNIISGLQRFWTDQERKKYSDTKLEYFKQNPDIIEKIKTTKRKYVYTLESNDGQSVTTDDVSGFCVINSLHDSAIFRTHIGKQKWHKGWRITQKRPKEIQNESTDNS